MEIFYINSIGCVALFICLLIKILPTHNIMEAIARDPFWETEYPYTAF